MSYSHYLLTLITLFIFLAQSTSFRTWRCLNNKCIKEETNAPQEAISIKECKVRCLEYGGLWPRPTGSVLLSNRTSQVNVDEVFFENNELPEKMRELLTLAKNRFLTQIKQKADKSSPQVSNSDYKVKINLEIYDPSILFFTTGADESYKLQIFPPNSSNEILCKIEANTFFGVRHGLETLSQLFFYDDIHKCYKMVDEASINDAPVFTHRGIVLDTARSYISVENILKLLDVMGANKLNTFHWHITDSQSFPYVSLAYPELSEAGAYSEDEVYNQSDIKKLVNYAQSLGIRIIPEFDAPAHVGEGWSALGSDLITCFKWQPWRNYCVEPPCGQFDPTNERVYKILGAIFKEYVDLFQSDLFHLGGDEVDLNCWKSTPRIVEWMKKMNYSLDDSGYFKLWGEYQDKVLGKLKETKSDPHPQAVLWTSTLTMPNLIGIYIKPEDYIIQIWTKKTDLSVKTLIKKKFRVIFSNYDELYFDCGGSSWVGHEKQNWCSPFIGWQSVYQHSPFEILEKQGIQLTEEVKKLVLGSESAIWTEQIDNHNLQVRLWPRAAALGERLWSNPKEDWEKAQFRMNHHRERLSSKVSVEVLQPYWCYQNDGFCD